MVVPAIPEIAVHLNASVAATTWILSANLAMTALSLPLVGRLGDIFGRRRALLGSLSVFALGSVVAALAPTLGWLIGGRAVQGVGGGIFAVCFGLAREVLPARDRARGIGILAVSVGVGGAIGLPAGGAILDVGSYAWIFWANVGMALAAIVGVLWLVPKTGLRYPAPVDVAGAVSLAAAVGFPLVAISRAAYVGVADPRNLSLVAIAALSIAVFVRIERRAASPLVDMSILGQRQVVVTNLATFLVGGGNFAVMVLVPQVVQAQGAGLGLGATRAGLLLLPGALVMIPVGAGAARITAWVGNALVVVLGGAVSASGFVLLAFRHGDQTSIVLGAAAVFAGVALVMAALTNLIVDVVPHSQIGEATGVNGLFRLSGSAAGAAVAVAILTGSASTVGELAPEAITAAFATFAAVMVLSTSLALVLPRSPKG
jgi:hypothetical protein